jgi:hypothetical protein
MSNKEPSAEAWGLATRDKGFDIKLLAQDIDDLVASRIAADRAERCKRDVSFKHELESCTWIQEDSNISDDGLWHTGCDKLAFIPDGTPSENSMNYCWYCGKRLVEKLFVPDEEADDEYR